MTKFKLKLKGQAICCMFQALFVQFLIRVQDGVTVCAVGFLMLWSCPLLEERSLGPSLGLHIGGVDDLEGLLELLVPVEGLRSRRLLFL